MGIEVIRMKLDTQKMINLVVRDDNADKPLMPLILDCRKLF